MMARYGDPVIEWWNHAFEEVVESGEYDLLCDAAHKRHGKRDDHGYFFCITAQIVKVVQPMIFHLDLSRCPLLHKSLQPPP